MFRHGSGADGSNATGSMEPPQGNTPVAPTGSARDPSSRPVPASSESGSVASSGNGRDPVRTKRGRSEPSDVGGTREPRRATRPPAPTGASGSFGNTNNTPQGSSFPGNTAAGNSSGFNGMPPNMYMMMTDMMQRMFQGMQGQGYNANSQSQQNRDYSGQDGNRDFNKVILDEKYFRRMEKFGGDASVFRGWLFDLLVAIGQIDSILQRELKDMLKLEFEEKNWDPVIDGNVDDELHGKYAGELYAVLCALTTGEAKNIVKSVADQGKDKYDGFKALGLLNKRFDMQTISGTLQQFMEVVSPEGIKKSNDLVSKIHNWEARVVVFLARHEKETLSENMRLAILVGMLPKEYQEILMQSGSLKKMTYASARDNVIQVATQRVQSLKPTPMEIDNVNRDEAVSYTHLTLPTKRIV